MMKRLLSGAAFGVLSAVGACSQAGTGAGSTSQCVDIPDVDLFTVEGGKFVPASSAVDTGSIQAASVAIPALVAGLGFDWMSGARDGATVNINGVAPDAAAKSAGFAAASAAVEAQPDFQSGAITTINDRITVADGSAAIESRLAGVFSGQGFPWMGLNLNGTVATLTGTAPDLAAKEAAFTAGKNAVEADADLGERVSVVVDGISVEGGSAGVGAAVAALPANPTVGQCQNAFVQVMDGRNVEFEVNQAVINSVSGFLLDAASGVALLCDDYQIEVGGHTDSRGSDDYNLDLSQRRASAVRQYLIERGVAPEGLTAVGYGETRPLDAAMTLEAYEKNRRTEFVVQAR
ncbi:MAG: OmpA family protein [Pseudomonadota bacterium]